VILVGAVPGPMGYYLRTSEPRCSPRRSHPGHWSPGSRLGPCDGARGSPEGRGERGRQLAAGGVLGGGDGGGFRGWTAMGESGRGDAREEVWVSAAAARAGDHSPVGAGGEGGLISPVGSGGGDEANITCGVACYQDVGCTIYICRA
jgi:hypothetical protein